MMLNFCSYIKSTRSFTLLLIGVFVFIIPIQGYSTGAPLKIKCDTVMGSPPPILDKKQVMDILPHRGIWLLIDRVLSIEPYKEVEDIHDIPPGTTITAQFDVRSDWPVFKDHYPGNPVFPGNFMEEAIEQAAALLVLTLFEATETQYPILKGTQEKEVLNPVTPSKNGATYPLTLRATLVEKKPSEYFFEGEAILPDGIVAMKLKRIKATLVGGRLMKRLVRPRNY